MQSKVLTSEGLMYGAFLIFDIDKCWLNLIKEKSFIAHDQG